MFKIIYLLTFIFSGAVYSSGAAANQGSAHSTVSENAGSYQLFRQLREAVGSGSYADVQNLIEAGVDVNVRDEGRTALVYTLCKREVDAYMRTRILLSLIRAGADVSASNDYNGMTVLMEALVQECSLAFDLIRAGADVNAKDNEGRTALSRAQDRNNEAMVNLLKQKFSPWLFLKGLFWN